MKDRRRRGQTNKVRAADPGPPFHSRSVVRSRGGPGRAKNGPFDRQAMERVAQYLCSVRLQGRDRVVLWETSEGGADRVVVDDTGGVVSYASEAEARNAVAAISGEPASFYDLDAVAAWCRSGDLRVDCSTVLDTWNFLADVPHDRDQFAAAEAHAAALYDKLFHGCNLPAMGASPGEYVPTWSPSEVAALKRLLALGITEFRSRCGAWDAVAQGVAADRASPRR